MHGPTIYLDRYAYSKELLSNVPIPEDLGLIVVIPSYNETNLLPTLQSLDQCYKTKKSVEVIVIINQPENCSGEVEMNNLLSLEQVKSYQKKKTNPIITFHGALVKDLPVKHSGVGLARKIGMDEAVRRFIKANNNKGVIVNFDADCTCERNYLQLIEQTFNSSDIFGASIYFEHKVYETDQSGSSDAIIQYELHLRYLIHALRFCGFPYSFHTVGSSMAVRTDIYQKQGGMNRRKAGEDFYFLQKIFPLGNFTEINKTKVFPSSRISTRVPFGTGKAMIEWQENASNTYLTYSPKTFEDLKKMLPEVDGYYFLNKDDLRNTYNKLPQSLKDFISPGEFIDTIRQCQQQSASLDTYRSKFFIWMNGLKILKYIHHCRDHFYQNVSVKKAGMWAIEKIFNIHILPESTADLLFCFRQHDRENPVRSDQKGQIHPVSVQP